MMLRCMSPKMALRDILRRRAILVVIGSIADIGWQPGLGRSVANDPFEAFRLGTAQADSTPMTSAHDGRSAGPSRGNETAEHGFL